MIDAHRSSIAMARVLVQYIPDPHRVREIVRGEFERVPDVTTIAAMRAKHLRPGPAPLSFKQAEERYFASMEKANTAFLAALRRAGRTITTN